MTIEQNKKMINNYFKNCCRFDVIYQNKIGDIDLKSSIQDKETSNNNRTCLTASSLKKILNANKEKKYAAISKLKEEELLLSLKKLNNMLEKIDN